MAQSPDRLDYAAPPAGGSNRNAWIVATFAGAASGFAAAFADAIPMLAATFDGYAPFVVAAGLSVVLGGVGASIAVTHRALFGCLAVVSLMAGGTLTLLARRGISSVIDRDSIWVASLLAIFVAVPGVFSSMTTALATEVRRARRDG